MCFFCFVSFAAIIVSVSLNVPRFCEEGGKGISQGSKMQMNADNSNDKFVFCLVCSYRLLFFPGFFLVFSSYFCLTWRCCCSYRLEPTTIKKPKGRIVGRADRARTMITIFKFRHLIEFFELTNFFLYFFPFFLGLCGLSYSKRFDFGVCVCIVVRLWASCSSYPYLAYCS